MLAIRKLDLKLIEKLLPQLEDEEIQAEIAVELAEKALYSARLQLDEARSHVLQMRGEYDLAQDESESTQVLLSTGKDSGQDNFSEPQPPSRFWNQSGFSWRQFLPIFIESQNIPMTYNDVKSVLELTEQEEEKLDSTISSALSHLAKTGTLFSYSLPGIRGQFYSVPSFYEDGVLKEEYFQKITAKVVRPGSSILGGHSSILEYFGGNNKE